MKGPFLIPFKRMGDGGESVGNAYGRSNFLIKRCHAVPEWLWERSGPKRGKTAYFLPARTAGKVIRCSLAHSFYATHRVEVVMNGISNSRNKQQHDTSKETIRPSMS